MFCVQCGEKFLEAGQFCHKCGAQRVIPPASGASLIASENKPAPSSPSTSLEEKFRKISASTPLEQVPERFLQPRSNWESRISTWLEEFTNEVLPLVVQLEGFVNAEQGMVWLSDRPIYSCDICDDQYSSNFTQTQCSSCGRTETNFASAPIGKGDGTYPIFQLVTNATQSSLLAILATEMDEDGYGPANGFVLKVLNDDQESVGLREALSKVQVVDLLMDPEFVLTSIGSINVETRDFASGNYELPGLTQLIVSGPRARKYLDCAEIRVGWASGFFEVIAVTTASELDRVANVGSLPNGGVGYFERPEVLAVLFINTHDLETLIPPYKKLMTLKDSGLTKGSDRWTELQRVMRGDFITAWANWEYSNQVHSTSQDGSFVSLAKTFIALSREGYLHQLWNWMETKPPSLAGQIQNLGQLGPRFATVLGWSTQPGGTITREDLRNWFEQDNR